MKKNGFTLVELILTITLIGILFTISATVLRQGLDSYAHISSRGAGFQSARYALERMCRELVKVGDENNNNIQNIQSDQITFVDSDGLTADFTFLNQALWRGADKLLDNVTAVTFTGYRDNGSTTSSGTQVRRVKIEFTTLPPGETASINLRTDIFIRNYMYENFQ